MIDVLFDAAKGFVWLLWEGVQYLFVDLLAKPMKAQTGLLPPGTTLEEAIAAIDPCSRGDDSVEYYRTIAERMTEVALSMRARSDRLRAAIVRQTLEEYGCEASRTDVRRCAQALAAHQRDRGDVRLPTSG